MLLNFIWKLSPTSCSVRALHLACYLAINFSWFFRNFEFDSAVCYGLLPFQKCSPSFPLFSEFRVPCKRIWQRVYDTVHDSLTLVLIFNQKIDLVNRTFAEHIFLYCCLMGHINKVNCKAFCWELNGELIGSLVAKILNFPISQIVFWRLKWKKHACHESCCILLTLIQYKEPIEISSHVDIILVI